MSLFYVVGKFNPVAAAIKKSNAKLVLEDSSDDEMDVPNESVAKKDSAKGK